MPAALTESRRVRLAALVVLYVGQGLPQGLLVVALPAYLAERGASAAAIGAYLGAVLLPFALKAFVGPVMDRFTFLPMGRRRPWVLAGGLGVVAGFLAMAGVPDALAHMAWLTAAGVLVNASVAVQDTAVDGLAVDVVPLEEQSRANALMWGGAVLGVAVAAIGTGRLLDAGGVTLAAGTLAALLGALWGVPALLLERPGERRMPWSLGHAATSTLQMQPEGWQAIARRLGTAMRLPSSLALAAAGGCAGALDGLVIAWMPVLAVGELGWTDTGYSSMVGVAQVAAGVVGMILGAVLIERVGRVRMLVRMAGTVALVLAAMAASPSLWPAKAVVVAFALGYLTSFVLLTITLLATGMALCSRAVAATQFALFTAAMNVGRSSGSGLLGPLDRVLGPSALFGVAAALAVVVAVVASRIDLEAHRQRLGL